MKRSAKIVIFLVTLVVVIAAYFVVTKLVEIADERAAANNSADEEIVLFDGSTLSKATWTFEGETHAFTVSGGTWVLTENRNFPLDETLVEAMGEAVKEIKTSRWLDDVTDYEQYGLEGRACELQLTNDEGTLSLKVGDINAATNQCYVRIEGDPKVYLVSSSLREAFAHTLLQLANLEEITQPTDVFGFAITDGDKSICLELVETNSAISTSEDAQEKWVRKLDGFGGSQEEEIAASTVETLMGAIEKFVTNMAWYECADVDLREKEFANYGLDNPTCKVEFYYHETANTSTGEFNEDGSAIMEPVVYNLTKSFTFGTLVDGYYYATSSETNRCYLVEEYIVQAILDLEPYLFENPSPQE